jgi:signal transduction histidine kinase
LPGTTRRRSGRLGLPIAKRLTELVGGTIAVDTGQGVGTAFTVQFPR